MKRFFDFRMRGRYFEIFKDTSTDGVRYVGYVDGSRTADAREADVLARVLINKYVNRTPEAVVIDWEQARALRGSRSLRAG